MSELEKINISFECRDPSVTLSRSYSLLLAFLAGRINIDFYPRRPITRNDAIGYGMISIPNRTSGAMFREESKGFSNKIRLILIPSPEQDRVQSLTVDIHANFRHRPRWLRHLPPVLIEKFLNPDIEIVYILSYSDGFGMDLIRTKDLDGDGPEFRNLLYRSYVTTLQDCIYGITKTL